MSIVTKKGDTGKTTLANGKTISKSDVRVETYGTLDELDSFLGLARSFCQDSKIAESIKKIQSSLFLLGTELALGDKFAEPTECSCCEHSYSKEGITTQHLEFIEDLIDAFEPKLKLKGFAIPGNSKPSATLDVARAVCRRLERRVVHLKEIKEFKNEIALKYLNRLADLLFIFARVEE